MVEKKIIGLVQMKNVILLDIDKYKKKYLYKGLINIYPN